MASFLKPVELPIIFASHTETQDLEAAVKKLEEDLENLRGVSGKRSYGAVKAVFLNWDKCDLDPDIRDETEKLQTLLRDQYHFDAGKAANIYRIPSDYPEVELKSHIASIIKDFSKVDADSKDKLMIVYYNGHGGYEEKSREFYITGNISKPMKTNKTKIPIKAYWSGVQNLLLDVTDFDVLLIMDCCYAARLIKAASTNCMEVLCAASRETIAAMKKNTGSLFTTALIKHLGNATSQPEGLRISELHTLMSRDQSLGEQSPNHTILKGHQEPIVLQPLVLFEDTSRQSLLQSTNESGDSDELESGDSDGSNSATEESSNTPFPTLELQSKDKMGNRLDLKVAVDAGSWESFMIPELVARLPGGLRRMQMPKLLSFQPNHSVPIWRECYYYFSTEYSEIIGNEVRTIDLRFNIAQLVEGVDFIIGRNVLLQSGIFDKYLQELHKQVQAVLQSKPTERQTASNDPPTGGTPQTSIGDLVRRIMVLRQLIKEEFAGV